MRPPWLLFLLACGAEREIVTMPLPPIDAETRSLVFVFEGETTFLYAVDLGGASGPLLDVIAPGWMSTDLTASAFTFDRPLTFYGLGPGLLTQVEESRSCGLQRPRSAAQYDRAADLWTLLAPPYAALGKIVDEANYGCDPVDLCRSFSAEVEQIDSNSDVHFLLQLDEKTALLGVETDRFFEVSRARGVVERTDLFGLPALGALRTETEIWLGGQGVVARGTLVGGFVETPLGSPGESFGAFGVRGEGEDLEVIAMSTLHLDDTPTSTVTLYRFFGGEWAQIHRRVVEADDAGQADVHWLDERALIVFGGPVGLIWDGTVISEFAVESPLPLFIPHLNDLAARPDYPVVLASNDGFLYRMESGPTDWSPIQESALGNGIKGVAPVFEGFFFGGPDGTVNQFYPGSVSCASQRLVTSDAERIVLLEGDLLVTGGNPQKRNDNTVTWLSAAD